MLDVATDLFFLRQGPQILRRPIRLLNTNNIIGLPLFCKVQRDLHLIWSVERFSTTETHVLTLHPARKNHGNGIRGLHRGTAL